MRVSDFVRITTTLGAVLLLSGACASQLDRSRGLAELSVESETRLLIKSGDIVVEVNEPLETRSQVEEIISSLQGWIETTTSGESSVSLVSRVPSAGLESAMTQISELGRTTRRSVSTRDVTETHSDISIRLENARKLRDRMKDLVAQAQDVKDILAIESELSRLQSQIESMESQLGRMNSEIEMSRLSVRIDQKLVLGPLGFVGYWTAWAFSKLFIIR